MGNIFGFLRKGVKRKSSTDHPDRKKMKYSQSEEPTKAEEEKREAREDGDGQPQAKRRGLDLVTPEKELSVPKGGSAEDEFKAKFRQRKIIGVGGFGSVFAGYRKADDLPVAIKHIPKKIGYSKNVVYNGKWLPSEVAIMLKLADKTGGSAPVSLIDWYDLDQELVLVVERPFPAEDLYTYVKRKGGILQETVAKIILKQLVDAAIALHAKGVFHRDIKLQNILIETRDINLRVRLIDFGLSCFVKNGSSYRIFCGTLAHAPPEVFSLRRYKAGPTTVFQMGVVLFETLHKCNFKLSRRLRVNQTLSKDCKDFMQKCFTEDPNERLTLEQLKQHQWLI